MINNFQEQAKQMGASGEILIDADPVKGFFRVKIRNVQPPQALPQVTMGFCWVLQNGAAMFNLQFKQHIRKPGEDKDE